MNAIKKSLLMVFPLLSMVSCGPNDDITGKYSFQLGAQEGTHVAIRFDLTNEEVEVLGKEDAKKYTMEFDVGGNIFGALAAAAGEDSSSESSNEDEDPIKIDGYYTIQDLDDGSKILHLGVWLFDEIDIPDELVEYIMYATYSEGMINVVIPVSVADLQYQLYWYGYRISSLVDIISPVKLVDESPEFVEWLQGNDIGTYPSDEAIGHFKEYQKNRKETAPDYDEKEDIFLSFHKHHTIKMGFSK